MGDGRTRFVISIAATFLLVAGGAGASRLLAAQQGANWIGGTGNWGDGTRWSGGVVPNNNAADTFDVNIDNGNPTASTVVLGGTGFPTYTVDALTIDAGDRLYLSAGSLNAAGLTVDGTLQLDYTSAVTLPANATVGGSGTILYSMQAAQLAASSGTLTIDSGLTVRGGDSGGGSYFGGGGYFARLGSATTALRNRGTIHADGPSQLLVLTATAIDNQGTLQASNGGFLGFQADFALNAIGNLVNNGGGFVIFETLSNTGQTAHTDRARGWVLAAGGTIDGGTVATSGPGYVEVPYVNTGTLHNVTLNGHVRVNGDLRVTGTAGGNGTITINNPEAIEGSGNIYIDAVPSGLTVRGGLSEQYDPDISPGGFPGERARVHLTANHGRIRAQKSIFDDHGRLRLMPTSGETITNYGAVEVSDGGTLISLANLTFAANSDLVVDGGGLLEVQGNLDLSALSDFLQVLPRADGAAYNGQLIATYTGTLSGTFGGRTPGIVVQYATTLKQIRISGTPVPEPAGTAAVGMGMAMAGLARRRRCLRRG